MSLVNSFGGKLLVGWLVFSSCVVRDLQDIEVSGLYMQVRRPDSTVWLPASGPGSPPPREDSLFRKPATLPAPA